MRDQMNGVSEQFIDDIDEIVEKTSNATRIRGGVRSTTGNLVRRKKKSFYIDET